MADKIRVLYVDDEPDLLDIGKIFLESSGDFTVDTVVTAPPALDLIQKIHYDAIVSDYQMPEMNGIEFLKKVRLTDKTIPFILFTGRGREEVVIEAINNGADFYVQKGGDPTSMFAELRHKIRHAVLLRQTQISFAEQEERYHDIQNATDLIQSVTPDGHFLFVNKKWQNTLGYREHELKDLTIFDIIHEESLEHCMKVFPQAMSGENIGIIDAVFKTRDGKKVYVEGFVTCKIINGQPQYTRGIFKNVTDRKRVEAALTENQDYLTQIFESVQSGIVIIDAKTHEIIDLNPAAAKMIGSAKDQITGKICHKFICPAEQGRCPITDLHQNVDNSERVLLKSDGQTMYIIKYAVPFNFQGRECLLETFIDNTDRKLAADDLHSVYAKITAAEEELRHNCTVLGEKEQALRESEERLRLFIQQAPVAIAMFDRKMQYIAVSHRWVANFHLKDQDLLGRSHYEIFPEISKELKDIHRRGLSGEVLSSDEDKFVREDGSVQWLAWEVRPWHTTGNSIGGIIIISEDITTRKRSEEALQESEEKYRTLVEYTLDGIIILDPHGTILFANRAAGRLIGTENCSERIGVKNVMEFIAPESQGVALEDFNQVSQGIDGYLSQYKVITLQQQERLIESVGKSIHYKGGPAIQVSLRDITERQLADTAMKESENRFRTIFDNSPYPIAINSLPDNKFLEVNAAFLNASGYTAEEVLGKNPIELGLISLLDATRLISHRLLQGKIENVPLGLTAQGGRRIHVLFTSVPVTINNKAATLTVIAEITTLKRIEEELLLRNEDLNAAYEELTATDEELRANYDELAQNDLALRTSEEKYRLLTETTNDIIYMTDTQGTLTHVSPQIIRYGYTPDEVISHNISEFICKEDVGNVIADLEETLSKQKPTLTPLKVRDKAGSIFWMEDNHAPVIDKSGTAIGISGILRDVTERHLAMEAIREKEEKFRALVENSLDGIIIADFTGKILFANKAAGHIIDVTDQERLIGKTNVMEFVAPESQENVLYDFSQVARGIDAYLVPYKLITEKRREVWVESIGRKIPFEGSVAILVSMRDITEKKRAEAALGESEKKFAIMFRSNPVALTLVSAIDGKFIDISDTFLTSTGYSREEVIGKTSEELGIFVDMNEYALMASAVKEKHHVNGIELQCRTKRGEIRICRFSSSSILMGSHPHIISTVEDITERKRTEDALHESEELFREVFSNANDGITLVENISESLGRFRLVNDRIAQLLGYSRDELLQISPQDLLPTEFMKEKLPDPMKKQFGVEDAVFESAYRRKDGSSLPVEVSIHRFSYQGKDVALGIVRDISERKQAEDAMRKANKKLNLLSGITRHDIRNQLLTLDSFVELLSRNITDSNPTSDKYLSRIKSASREIAAMIQFTKEYEQVGMHLPIWQDLQTLVNNAGKSVTLGTVTLKNNIPPKTEIIADPLITKVIFNQIDNALRHGGKITTIRFSLEILNGDCTIVCDDDGDGVEHGLKKRIFEMGFGKNTGFGLSISREILDITGITIQENGEPGKGARFEIAVPKGAWRVPSEK